MKKFYGAIVVIAAMAATGAIAEDNPILARKAILKGFGEATRPIGGMLKGETPYDDATVKKALATLVEGAKKLPDLFPDDSKTGNDTAALPKIWEEKPKFVAIYARLGEAATAAQASIHDEATLKANIGSVFGACKSCHDDYRAKKN